MLSGKKVYDCAAAVKGILWHYSGPWMIMISVLCSKPIEWETPSGEKAQVNLQLQFSAFFGYGQVDAEPGYLGLQCHGILWPVMDSDLPPLLAHRTSCHLWEGARRMDPETCSSMLYLVWGQTSRAQQSLGTRSATCQLQVAFVLWGSAEVLHWSQSRECFLQQCFCMRHEPHLRPTAGLVAVSHADVDR